MEPSQNPKTKTPIFFILSPCGHLQEMLADFRAGNP